MDAINFANDCSKCINKSICKYIQDVAKIKKFLKNEIRGSIFSLLIDVECKFWESSNRLKE